MDVLQAQGPFGSDFPRWKHATQRAADRHIENEPAMVSVVASFADFGHYMRAIQAQKLLVDVDGMWCKDSSAPTLARSRCQHCFGQRPCSEPAHDSASRAVRAPVTSEAYRRTASRSGAGTFVLANADIPSCASHASFCEHALGDRSPTTRRYPCVCVAAAKGAGGREGGSDKGSSPQDSRSSLRS